MLFRSVNGESITATLVVYAVTGKGGGPALSLNLGQTVDIDLEPYLSMLYSPTTTTVSSSFGFNSGYSAGYKLVTASDWEAFGEPVTLTVSGLPAGLSVVDNHIVGTLTTHGSGTYTVTATNARFSGTSAPIAWSVAVASMAPRAVALGVGDTLSLDLVTDPEIGRAHV